MESCSCFVETIKNKLSILVCKNKGEPGARASIPSYNSYCTFLQYKNIIQ